MSTYRISCWLILRCRLTTARCWLSWLHIMANIAWRAVLRGKDGHCHWQLPSKHVGTSAISSAVKKLLTHPFNLWNAHKMTYKMTLCVTQNYLKCHLSISDVHATCPQCIEKWRRNDTVVIELYVFDHGYWRGDLIGAVKWRHITAVCILEIHSRFSSWSKFLVGD